MASSPGLVCTQQTVRDRHSVSVQLQGSYRGSWQLDTTLTILQYYTLKYHSRCSRLLKHNPAAWRLPTLHTWHLFQATRSRRRSHNKAPLVCSLSTLALSVHWTLDGMKGKFSEDRWMLFGIVTVGYTSAYKTYCPNEDVLAITSLIIIISSGDKLS